MASKNGLIIVWLVLLSSYLVSANFTLYPEDGVSVELKDENGGISLTAKRGSDVRYVGLIGAQFPGSTYKLWHTDRLAILEFGAVELKLSVTVTDERWQLNVQWTAPSTERLVDCFDLGNLQWFGGPQQKKQYWPVQKLNLTEYSYVTKEDQNNGVAEPYWINSEGTILYVDKEVPLFIDQHNYLSNHLCFIAEVKDPYSTSRTVSNLIYDIVFTKNARVGHEYAVGRYLGKPVGYPDFRMIQHPIWSTWARYYRDIDHDVVMEFTNEIVDHGFNNSHIDIDDLWETCYGSLTVDTNKFPNITETVQDIKDLGFRTTLWIHPFINENCDPWFTEARDKGYLVKDEDGGVYTKWWNSNATVNASYVDFTNPEAKSWWIKRVMDLKITHHFDSFKFDAGESSWSPQIPVQNGEPSQHPSHITSDYVRAVADFGPMIEVRTGQRSQDLPIFVRMLDKDSRWTFENGLPTLVTTLFQLNMNGYPLVLPDMIGGNGYDGDKPDKELFIRWLQANTFMPSLQFSFVPWDYDNETVKISHKFTDLHAQYAEEIKRLMQLSVADGTPVNMPIWWIDPTDNEALMVWDEYLLGESILVAPVLEKNAESRDIYLPKGAWFYGEGNEMLHEGPVWLRNFSAPLDTLPYFRRANSASRLGGLYILTPLLILMGLLMK